MLEVFCLRLGLGMLFCLLLLPAVQSHPRFYRTHFLTVLGLSAVALWGAWNVGSLAILVSIGAGLVLALLAAVVWSIEGAPGGGTLIVLTGGALATALVLIERECISPFAGLLADDATSALLLGSAMTAMLMGHSYLIAPGMSMTPLLRMLGTLGVALLLRVAVDGVVLFRWTSGQTVSRLDDEAMLWLPVRWLVGLVLPLVLGWMAWQSARIRSTQSATGILYVVVIFCFLGELISQLLRNKEIML